jgi:hypothetical protein
MRTPSAWAGPNRSVRSAGRPYRPSAAGGQSTGFTFTPSAASWAAVFQFTRWPMAWNQTSASGAAPAGTNAEPVALAAAPSPSTEPVT